MYCLAASASGSIAPGADEESSVSLAQGEACPECSVSWVKRVWAKRVQVKRVGVKRILGETRLGEARLGEARRCEARPR